MMSIIHVEVKFTPMTKYDMIIYKKENKGVKLKLYSVKRIKSFFGNKNKHITTKQISDFFSDVNLYETIGIGNFYLDKNIKKMVYLNEDDLHRLCLLAHFKLQGDFSFDKLEHHPLGDNILTRQAKSSQEYRNLLIEHYKSPEMVALSKEEKQLASKNKLHNQEFSSNIANYEIEIANKKIVAIDFEYNPKTLATENFNFTSCSECGVSVLENNEMKHYHFFIEDGSHKQGIAKYLKDKFEFGQTETITSEQLKIKLNDIFKGADYMLCHGMEIEYTILNGNDIKIANMNIEILDTLHMFKKLASDTELNAYRLKDILRACDMDPLNLHNAGNDAAYTLLTFLRMNKEPELMIENIKKLATIYKEKEKNKPNKLGMV